MKIRLTQFSMLFAISYLVLYDLALSFEVCVKTIALQNKDRIDNKL